MADPPKQARAFNPDGTPIDPNDLARAVQEGRAGFEAGQRVMVRDADGRAGTVLAEDVPQLLASGGAIETDLSLAATAEAEAQRRERAETILNPAQHLLAFYEGQASGQTLGLAPAALGALLGEEYEEGARRRAEHLALERGAAEFVGTAQAAIAPTLLGAGAPVALGLATAPGRLLGAAGAGGEALAAGAARAAGLGGGLIETGAGLIGRGAAEGAVLGAGHEIGEAALHDQDLTAERLLAGAGYGAIAGGAFNAALGGLSGAARGAMRDALGGRTISEAAEAWSGRAAVKDLGGNRFYDDLTMNGAQPGRAEALGSKLHDAGMVGRSLDDQIGIARSRLAAADEAMSRIGAELDAAGQRVSARGIFDASFEQVAKLRQVPLGEYREAARGIEKQLRPFAERVSSGEPLTFGEMISTRNKLAEVVERSDARGLDTIKRAFDDAIEQSIPDETASAAFRAAREDAHDFGVALKAATDAKSGTGKGDQAGTFTGGAAFLSALMSGGAALPAMATAAVTKLATQAVVERAPGVVARIVNQVAKGQERTAQALRAAVEGNPKELPGLPKRTSGSLLSALDTDAPEPVQTPISKRERYLEATRLVTSLARAEPIATERLGSATADLSPAYDVIAAKLHAKATQSAQWLAERKPVPLSRADASLTPQLEAMRVPAPEASKWLRQYDAIDQPERALHDLARGHFDPFAWEAIKAVYPREFAEWRGGAMRLVAERGETLGRPQRIRLSLAFDFTGDKSIEPSFLAGIQADYAATDASRAEQQPPRKAVNPGAMVTNMATETQRQMGQM